MRSTTSRDVLAKALSVSALLTLIASISVSAASAPRTGGSSASCYSEPVPPGAAMAGLTHVLFDICPTASSINFQPTVASAGLFNGVWWSKTRPSADLYATVNESLQIHLGGVVTSVSPKTMKPSTIPLLPGEEEFYIEISYSLSDNNADHWPAVWSGLFSSQY